MKKLLSLVAIAALLFTACNDQSSIVTPDIQSNSSNTTLKYGNKTVEWLQLPAAKSNTLRKEFFTAADIADATGGTLTVNEEYYTLLNSLVKVYSSISFPVNYMDADDDDVNDVSYITMTVDDATCTSTFTPHMEFYNHPILNAKYEGVNLTGIDPATIEFVYLAEDGTVERMTYDALNIDVINGTLEVINAVIPHFSRYGYVNEPPPPPPPADSTAI